MTDSTEPENVIEGTGTQLLAAEGTLISRPTAPPTREVLVPLDAEKVVAGMEAYQDLLPRLLDASDYQGTGEGAFVKKSGWRKIARAFNLSVEIVSISIERDGEGKPTRAECIARALAPNGQVQDADGYCTIDEFTGKRAADVKLENTLRATATTRAKNRAISDLVGMGEVSAEEVTPATTGPPFGPAVDDEQRKATSAALTFLLDSDAERIWGEIVSAGGGYFPVIASEAIRKIARTLAGRAKAENAKDPEPNGTEFPPADQGGRTADGVAADAMADAFAYDGKADK